MASRGPNNERYCANTTTEIVHDVDNEKTNCQIAELIQGGNVKWYASVSTATAAGYKKCSYCQ